METILNLSALKAKMDNPPKGNKLYNFFDGAKSQLDDEQKQNIKEIIEVEIRSVINFIEDCIHEQETKHHTENTDFISE